jgi:8-oxo-dGTP pyrophosphatase MutT (NUDIX family)/transcriptional regulator with XRE-family HTH domain
MCDTPNMGAPPRPNRRSNTPGPTGRRVAANLRQIRNIRGLSTARLASAVSDLGQPLWPTAITKIEAGDRRVDVDDLVALAIALDTTPNRLLLADASGGKTILRHPGDTTGRPVDSFAAGTVDLTPAVQTPLLDAWEWATGDRPLSSPAAEAETTAADERVTGFRRENRPHAPAERYFDKAVLREHPELLRQAAALVRAARAEGVGHLLLHDFIDLALMTAVNGSGEPAEPAAVAGQQPVVAAIVTSAKGVLVGKRNDGKPPWTFIAGEVEPGEQPEDAAVREVKEETGCEIRTGEEIGRRVHPKTGRTMIYLAAKPERSTRLIVGDEAELAEVKWASLAEAEELMPDMFGPVLDYLARTLGGAAR